MWEGKKCAEMHCSRSTTCDGSLVCLLTLKRRDVGQKCCLQARGEQVFMSSLDVGIFSLDASVSSKDLHVSARHELMFPSLVLLLLPVKDWALTERCKSCSDVC